MPEMDGQVMSREIKKILKENGYQEKGTKIYAVTAMNQNFIKSSLRNFGIEDVISKPVDVKKLRKIIFEAVLN